MTGARPTLAELKKRYVDGGRALPADLEQALRADSRAGARAILEAIDRRRRRNRAEGQRLRRLLRYEQALWDDGVVHVAGVDEAGMSPLAGPVAAAAVILPKGFRAPGIDDSKKLDAPTRERLAAAIKAEAVAWAVARAEVEEIDRINIYHAGLLAMRRAVRALLTAPGALLVDARTLKDVPLRQQGIVKGDEKSMSIAAASILAKTSRDAWMCELDVRYPGYGFVRHKGYGVREHLEALERIGASPVHRRSFAPVRKVLGLDPQQMDMFGEAP
ncbi:MAG: ribonuclease HII [Myxococcota bacterium]